MSIVQENACVLNAQLDRFQQHFARPEKLLYIDDVPPPLVRSLQNVVNSVSVTSKTQPLLSPSRLVELLSDPALTHTPPTAGAWTDDAADYLWLVAAKAAVQASGLLMKTLLDHTLQLHEETYYWNEVLGSMWHSGLYAAQTSPVRLWHWTKDISPVWNSNQTQGYLSTSVAAKWARFHQIARQCLRGMSEYPLHLNLSSPIRSCRSEIRQKRDLLLNMKDIHTSSLGLLMEGWHSFQAKDFASADYTGERRQWQEAVNRTVVLTEAILQQVAGPSSTVEFEQLVSATLEQNTANLQIQSGLSSNQPIHLIQRLTHILHDQLPKHKASMSVFISDHGRPSRLTRYWLPVLAATMSSSASLRLLLHRQDEIIQWIVNIGGTIIDFGSNWVVEPIHKLVGTIRHDEKSEIAIMSKNSLLADRASLERMVIDFVRDRPDPDQSHMLGQDTTAITNAVKEGDLTPVLRAYERDLRSPFVGTVRGDLIRALLIQIQKTKVDVEIAISGINALLKSQELVFGFVGLTPGILVSWATLRWMFGLFGNRRGLRRGKRQHELRRGLRNVTRVLTSAPLGDGVISHKDSGRLIYEAEALLQQVQGVLGGMQYREFREDIQDLLDVERGVDRQLRVVERMRWAYFH
ncbi:uncharacterized protein N7443_005560 [Penicillium atrosanguineum]|uniref:uncharacterized protein n=1 Tax=Penicillium atrosanguineum TaxID=1132637 RepID=UPI002390BB46|nr:uncharacterized protein N7443_005560 [Penicillium atrosanguineum]KAJ5300558.1 hypothetical protein N7443_005560 [Penicillium atrosanguineum]